MTSIGALTPLARSLAISGSLRIASPTHDGAMTSTRSADECVSTDDADDECP
jgi:hypothetical protein